MLALAAVILGSTSAAFPTDVASERPALRRVRGRLIVRERAGLSPAALDDALARHGAERLHVLAQVGAAVLTVDDDELPAIEAALRRSGLFAAVERDYVAEAAETINDPYYPAQWGLSRIGAPAAWGVSTGDPSVVVAVLDTGVETSHPELAGQLLPGYDFVNNDADPTDDNGHGTRMTGIVAARRNNGTGIVGVASDARILPVKVLDAQGFGSYSAVASGITYAVDQGARVINLSLVGTAASTLLQSAVDYATARDVVVVAASGNYGTGDPMYPAAAAGAVAVSAVSSTDGHPSFSNYGAWIRVAAPGVDIVTTTLSAGYSSSTGTSPAAAFASGVFALLFAAEPALTRAEAVARVEDGAADLGSAGWDPYYGWGRLDAYAALVPGQSSVPPPDDTAPAVTITSPAKGSLVWGQVAVDVAASDNVGVARVDLFIDDAWYATATTAPFAFVIDTAAFTPGKHKLRAYAYDASGNWARSKQAKVRFTPGAGLLVERATARSSSVTIRARFALPEGVSFDPSADLLAVTLSSAAGTVLSATAQAGALEVSSGGKIRATVPSAVPAAGSVRLTAKTTSAQPVYTLSIRASDLTGMNIADPVMNTSVQVGDALLSQSVTFRLKGESTLVYP